MPLDSMHMNLMVKNTFLEFDLNDRAWQKEACRRRASVGAVFGGCEQAIEGDCQKDRCEIETNSTTGSDHHSLPASSEVDSVIDADLDEEASVAQQFYTSEWDDWETPYATDNLPEPDLHQFYSMLGVVQADIVPKEVMQQGRLDLDSSVACSQAPPTYFSTTPNQMSASNVAMVNAAESASRSPIGKQTLVCFAEAQIEQALTDSPKHDQLSQAPWRKHKPAVETQSSGAQSPSASRVNESVSPSPRRKQKGGWNAEPRSWQMSCESRQHESQSQSPSRKRGSPQGTSRSPNPEADYTTVMLRNLPNDYTRDMLVDLLESKGFGKCYDFLYLPFDFKRGSGLGYAFVNMTTNDEALRAMRILAGFHSWKLRSGKVLQVTWSTPLQGLWANIERYRNSPVMHPDVPEQFKPLLLSNGRLVQFPSPTRPIPTPQSTQS